MNLPKVGCEAVIEGMAKFSSDSSKVNKAFDGMGKSATGLGSIASSVTSQISGLVTSLAKIGAVGAGVAVAAIGAGLYEAASAGLEMNSAMEMASAKINAFTKDADLTQQILADVQKEAASTPFSFQEMADSVSGLLPAAKQADVGIMDLLRDAEVLAASNPAEGLAGATFALREAVSGDFTSVIERFNLPRQMINELKAEGVPALEIVRRSMQSMGYDMDLVTALANTASGRWSTFKDILVNVAATVTRPIFDTFSQGLGDINAWLTANEPLLTGMATLLAGQVSAAITNVVTGIQKVTGAFERFGVRGAAVSILGQLGMDPETIGLIRTTIDSVVEKIGVLQQIYAQFGAQGAGVSLLSMLGLSSETIALITTSIQSVMNGFNSLANWWIATWPTIQAAALTGWEILKGIFAGFQTALGPVLTQLNTQFTQVFGQIGTLLSSLGISWSDVWNALLTATGIVAAGIGAAIVGIIGVVAGLATGIAEGISAAITMFQGLATSISTVVTGITTIFVGFVNGVIALFTGDFAAVWTNYQIVLQGAATLWAGIFSGMITVAVGTLDIISSSLSGFVEGVVGFFQGLYNTLVGHSIIPDLINDILNLFRELPRKILSSLSSLVSTVTKPFQDMATIIKEEVGESFQDFIDDTIPAFVEGFEIVIEGIKNFISSIKEASTTIADMVIPDWLQRHSPPPLALAFTEVAAGAGEAARAVELFGSRVAGAGKFIDDLNMGGIARAAGTGGGQWRNFRNIIKNQIGASFEQLMTSGMSAVEIMDKIRAVAHRFNFPPSFATEFAAANGLIEHLTSSITEFQTAMRIENMGRMLQMGGQLTGLAGGFASLLQERNQASGGLLSRIEELRDFLDSGEQRFRIFRDLGGGSTSEFFIDRNRAQREYNQLLEQQRQQEAMITQQKEAQQKLSFLQSQLDLIKLGRELGGNIFAGMTFGLNASVEDLLAATNAVTEAMINQINSDLQISSPSKVMARIGQQMMAGLQGGLSSMMPVLNTQLSASVAGPISPIMAGMMGGGASTTNIHNWNLGGNTINNGMNEAEWDARVLRTIRRNL